MNQALGEATEQIGLQLAGDLAGFFVVLAQWEANVASRLSSLEEERRTLRGLVEEGLDSDDCHYDHHGYCQTHGLFPHPCWQVRARAALTRGDTRDG